MACFGTKRTLFIGLKGEDGGVPVIESATIAASDWTSDSTISPFTKKATKTITATIGANSVVSLSMDVVAQAANGIVIGNVSGQTVTFYAVSAPTAATTVKVIIEG